MALLLAGCGSTPEAVEAAPTAATTVNAEAPAPARSDAANLDAFWTAFRQAALAGDAATLTRLSAPVVEEHGELDDDPVQRVPARDVPARVAALLASPEEVDASGVPLADALKQARPPAAVQDDAPDFRRVGPLVFERGANGWRLTQMYRGPDA